MFSYFVIIFHIFSFLHIWAPGLMKGLLMKGLGVTNELPRPRAFSAGGFAMHRLATFHSHVMG